MFLENSQNSQKNTCVWISFLTKLSFIKIETLLRVFSCEFYEISKNTFFLKNTSGGCFWTNWYLWMKNIKIISLTLQLKKKNWRDIFQFKANLQITQSGIILESFACSAYLVPKLLTREMIFYGWTKNTSSELSFDLLSFWW